MKHPEPNPPIPAILAQSQAAFYRDLPELLKTHYWKWVAYHGDERIGIARTQTELYKECLRRGLKENEFEVRSIDHSALADQAFPEPSERSTECDPMETMEPHPPVSPMIAQSEAAYYRDLPELLKTHYWEWVAYHGNECIGFARTETELYQRCIRRGLKPDEFVVMSIDYGALADHMEIDLPFLV